MTMTSEPRSTRDSPRIAYTTHGTQGPPVLLIMGLGMRGRVWKPQIEGLANRHRLITFDNRGIGESEDAQGPWRMAHLAQDALRVLDAAGHDSAHVIGVSLGGMIAQETALQAPERIRSLSLIATHPGGPTGLVPSLSGVLGMLAANVMPSRARFRSVAHLLYPMSYLRNVDQQELEARMEQQFGDIAPRRVRLKQIAAVAGHDTRSRLRAIELPTLIVRTGRDTLVTAQNQERLARRLPRADVVTFDHSGHGVIYQCRDALNGHLARHIARSERDGNLVIDRHP